MMPSTVPYHLAGFTDVAALPHSPHINLYRLADLKGTEIQGIYYEKELQKTSVPKTVQKVYRKDKRSGKKLVSLLDHPKEYREWTSA